MCSRRPGTSDVITRPRWFFFQGAYREIEEVAHGEDVHGISFIEAGVDARARVDGAGPHLACDAAPHHLSERAGLRPDRVTVECASRARRAIKKVTLFGHFLTASSCSELGRSAQTQVSRIVCARTP